MKLHRFFVSEKLEDKDFVSIHHQVFINQIKNVFRFTEGDKIILFDNSGYDFVSEIDTYNKDSVSLKVIEKNKNQILPVREIFLFVSIVKKDTFEWISEKATELGVSQIIPIISERSEKKNLNFERLNKIIIEASEQSGRGTLPTIGEILDIGSVIQKYSHIKSLAWHPSAEKFVSQDVSDISGIYIGPEGGWSPRELELFEKHKILVRSLGPQILRTETAVIATISRLVF